MNRAFAWAVSLALFLNSNLVSAGDNMTEKSAVLDTIKTMTSEFQNGEIDKVMSIYEPKAVVVFEPGSPIDDAAVLKNMFENMATVKPVFTYSGHDVIVSGDTALHIAPWSMEGTAPNGDKIVQSGLSVAVLNKQEDGSWKIVIDNPHGAALLESAK